MSVPLQSSSHLQSPNPNPNPNPNRNPLPLPHPSTQPRPRSRSGLDFELRPRFPSDSLPSLTHSLTHLPFYLISSSAPQQHDSNQNPGPNAPLHISSLRLGLSQLLRRPRPPTNTRSRILHCPWTRPSTGRQADLHKSLQSCSSWPRAPTTTTTAADDPPRHLPAPETRISTPHTAFTTPSACNSLGICLLSQPRPRSLHCMALAPAPRSRSTQPSSH